MKKLCLVLLLLASNANASDVSNGFTAVHDSSAGKLVSVYYSSGNLRNYVDTANGKRVDFKDLTLVFIANKICNFSQPWTGSDTTIYCIAK